MIGQDKRADMENPSGRNLVLEGYEMRKGSIVHHAELNSVFLDDASRLTLIINLQLADSREDGPISV